MTARNLTASKPRRTFLRNPHVWITVGISLGLLAIYQAWPWREWQFTQGGWRYFSWLSHLQPIVTKIEVPYALHGVLFLMPIIYGSLTASWPGGLIAWLLSLTWVLPTLVGWPVRTVAVNVALLLLPAMLVALITLERRWRESDKRNYAERERERQSYIARLVETQEAERRRIAQEIHDDTLQTLMAIANKSESLASSDDLDACRRGSAWIKEEILKTTYDLRRLSMNLRPSILDHFGLVSGIEWLANRANSYNSCEFEVQVEGEERELPELTVVTVFRVVQEAMQNVQRHAKASTATITLSYDSDCLRLTVHDDGIGFEQPQRLSTYAKEGKLGIIGIEHRILSVGGTTELESSSGEGVTLTASIPYQLAPS
jgi:signal transduction histidine kinase